MTHSIMVLAAINPSMTGGNGGGVAAFAPIHRPSLARSNGPFQAPSYHPESTTALQANMFDRIFRVSRANINSVLQRFEDPEKLIGQAVEDMQNDLIRVRQAYAETTASQRRLERSKKQLDSQADDWYTRAQLAMKKSNEGLARDALARREALLKQAKGIQDQIDTQADSLDALFQGMSTLERKIMEADSKKDQLKARARTAKSTQKVNDMVSGLTGKTSMDAFNRMEEKVLALETAAEISADMASRTAYKSLASSEDSVSDVELQFRMLEASDSVEEELEKLRAKVLPPSSISIESAKSVARQSKKRTLDLE